MYVIYLTACNLISLNLPHTIKYVKNKNDCTKGGTSKMIVNLSKQFDMTNVPKKIAYQNHLSVTQIGGAKLNHFF
jgi:hypothetical protein